MQSIQTSQMFPLSSVKPLEGLLRYRDFCLDATRKVLSRGSKRRTQSPIDKKPLEPWGKIGGLDYLRCVTTGSLFLAELDSQKNWGELLTTVSRYRHSPEAFHSNITESRFENVFTPKLRWIQDTLRLQGIKNPAVLEVATPPSDFTRLLKESRAFREICAENETELSQPMDGKARFEAAILLESLDRVSDPDCLLKTVSKCLIPGGLVFITGLVSSGFDMTVLGIHNAYLYPPDRTNCFSLSGLRQFVKNAGFTLLEVSTPGVLDLEIVKSHLAFDPDLSLSPFEKRLLSADSETQSAFQSFLQQSHFSSFARILAKKNGGQKKN